MSPGKAAGLATDISPLLTHPEMLLLVIPYLANFRAAARRLMVPLASAVSRILMLCDVAIAGGLLHGKLRLRTKRR